MPAPTKSDTRRIRSHLDVLFPDHDGNTLFGPMWKTDVSENPAAYPQIMRALSVAIGDVTAKYLPDEATSN